jgi:hypothetical protein
VIQTRPFEISDFTGGITDNIYRPDATKSQELDNLVILYNKSVQTRPGSELDDDVNPQIPAGAQRIGTLINYNNNDKMFVHSAKKLYYRNPSAYTTLQGPTSNDLFSSGSTTNIVSYSQWNGHIFITHDGFPRPMKIYKDNSSTYQLRSAGLPALASSPTVTAGAVGARTYLYAFHYSYEYMVGDAAQTFKDAGEVTIVRLTGSGNPLSFPNSISVIPVLSNGLTDNWDTTVIKVEIYRTTDGGDIFYKLGEVTNGTTTFNDNNDDNDIVDYEVIYTGDGSVDNEAPPLHKFFHVVNGIGYYGYLKEGSNEQPFTVIQSVPGDPDSVSLDFTDSVEDEIKGINSVKSVPVVLCKQHIYRIEGAFDQFGRGFMSHIRISDTAGCVSNQSCVQAENYLFWAGNDGFYMTDGYQVQKISDDNNDNYRELLSNTSDRKRIVGKYDEVNRRILWAVQTDIGSLDNDSCWVLDLRWGIRDDSTFTTWNRVQQSNSFAPTAIEFFDNTLYRADKRGYVFYHDEVLTTDPLVDTGVAPADWEDETIIHTYKSIAFNGGSNFERKIATRVLLTAKNKSNVSIQINAINDDGKIERELKEIRWRKNFIWGDQEFVWGNPNCFWNAEGLIEQWRRFPARGLRWSYLQIVVTNAFTIVTSSDTLGTATFSAVPNTVLLDDSANADWPIKAVGYSITTEADNYTKEFPITIRTDDTITVSDPQNALPNGSLRWELKGYPKDEVLNLLGLTLHWAPLSKSQMTFETGQSGGNA